jgi:hypothetical protein
MKRAQADVLTTAPFEFDRLANQLDDVHGLQDAGLAVRASCNRHGDSLKMRKRIRYKT